eukprot:CAMPEP_0172373044 /NCGR_PEP_ID=MMETSP1060-20121228/50245_1 /TAXON_ID=37318 /ORGANISM="Pseudo-nitzschia pungens, Strain cf. cingulata" /LENGTH=377 /DNA_ID=CAMNT_0013099253 /DNA_START=189 /DNA_END=1322 /DNA_ORIENTATION=+
MSQKDKTKEESSDAAAAAAADSDDSSDYSSEEDEDLVLEGVLVRNPDASDSSSEESDEDDSDDEDEEEEEEEEPMKPPAKKQKQGAKQSTTKPEAKSKHQTKTKQKNNTKKKKKKKKDKNNGGPEMVNMEFTFCDMNEKFFHGIKNLLGSSSPAYLPTASALSDLMIENVAVGTVISTEYDYKPGQKKDPDYEGVVYGFASVLNVTTHGDNSAVRALKKLCLSHCPRDRKAELETVLSGTTKRPAGFYFQSRMVNLPLEIVEILHQQLVLDMDWAVEHAGGTADQRKALDFGVFVRIAPTYREKGGSGRGGATQHQQSCFKYFDDELLANHAEFTYEIELPKTFGMEETPYCTVIVLTKPGHREAVKQLKLMVSGGT